MACPADFDCVANAPAGWMGPVILVTDTPDIIPDCPSDAPMSEFAARSGLTAPDAECQCTCDSPAELSCTPVSLYSGTACLPMGMSEQATVESQMCETFSVVIAGRNWRASESSVVAGDCNPNPTQVVPPSTWQASHRACSFGTPSACGPGICAPALETGERLCVYVTGDSATCPAGFEDRIITGEGVADDRRCEDCECGPFEGTCNGDILVSANCDLISTRIATIPLGTCGTYDIPGSAAARGGFTPSGGCTPQGGSRAGTAAPAIPRTVCCTP
ncbi:MAG: hypothetical protein AAGF12_02765 [Myxococcota bacterium]